MTLADIIDVMSYQVVAALSPVAYDYNGFVTSRQAHAVGVSNTQLKSMADAGILERVDHGIYRFEAAPGQLSDPTFWRWLAVSQGDRHGINGVPPVIVAGENAAELHDIGDFWARGFDFIVTARRFTRIDDVRLRRRTVEPIDVTYVDSIPVLTIEATLADLAGPDQGADLSLIGDAYRDARRLGRIVRPQRLVALLGRHAHRHGFSRGDGAALLDCIAPNADGVAA